MRLTDLRPSWAEKKTPAVPAWTSIILFTHPAGHVVSFQTLNPSESYLCRHQLVPCPLDRSDSPLLHDAAGGAIDCREKTQRGTKQRGDVDALLSILYPFGKLKLMKTYNIIAVERRYSASFGRCLLLTCNILPCSFQYK